MAAHPIARLTVSSFGPLDRVDIEMSPALNIVTGDNGTGKTQLLKLLYACTAAISTTGKPTMTKSALQVALAAKLTGVFRPDQLGRLARRTPGRNRAEVKVKYRGVGDPPAGGPVGLLVGVGGEGEPLQPLRRADEAVQARRQQARREPVVGGSSLEPRETVAERAGSHGVTPPTSPAPAVPVEPAAPTGMPRDPATPPESLQEILDGIGHGRLVVLDPAAHVPTFEQPDALSELIREHVADNLGGTRW